MFGFGNPLSGITSTVKLVAASTAVIAIVGYLAVQRADTITAATAEKEIEALLQVNRVNLPNTCLLYTSPSPRDS